MFSAGDAGRVAGSGDRASGASSAAATRAEGVSEATGLCAAVLKIDQCHKVDIAYI